MGNFAEAVTSAFGTVDSFNEKFGAAGQNLTANVIAQLRAAAETAVRVDPELGNFRNRDLANPGRAEIPAFQATSEMLSKITFVAVRSSLGRATV